MTALLLTACGSDDKDKEPGKLDLDNNLKVISNGSLTGIWMFVTDSDQNETYKYSDEEYSSNESVKVKEFFLLTEKGAAEVVFQPCYSSVSTYEIESDTINFLESDEESNKTYKLTFSDKTSASGTGKYSYNYSSKDNTAKDEEKSSSSSTIKAIKISHATEFESLGDGNAITLNLLEKNNVALIAESENFAINCYQLSERNGTRDSVGEYEEKTVKNSESFSVNSLFIKGKSTNDTVLAVEVAEYDTAGKYEISESGETVKGKHTYKSTDFQFQYTGVNNQSAGMYFLNEIQKIDDLIDNESSQWSGESEIGKDSASANVKTTGVGNGDNANFEFSLNYL